MTRNQRPTLPKNHVRIHFHERNATTTIPRDLDRTLRTVPDQVYRVELTREGILFRPVELSDPPPVEAPPWITSQTEDT